MNGGIHTCSGTGNLKRKTRVCDVNNEFRRTLLSPMGGPRYPPTAQRRSLGVRLLETKRRTVASTGSIARNTTNRGSPLHNLVKKAEFRLPNRCGLEDDGSSTGEPEASPANEIRSEVLAYSRWRSSTALHTMMSFILSIVARSREPICRLLPLAPPTDYENAAEPLDMGRLSVRATATVPISLFREKGR